MAKDVTKTTDDVKPKTGLAVQDQGTDIVGAEADDFFEGAGEGLQDFQQSDFLIPYVRIVQALSKELQRNHAKFLQGAEQGAFVNSATRKVYNGEKGFLAIPVSFAHRYMAWKPNNGGPAYDMGPDATLYNSLQSDDKGKRKDKDGNEITDSLQFFIMLVDKETFEYEMAVLNFSGSQAKKARGWITTINNRMERRNGQLMRPAIYFYSYDISSVPESNDQGSWYGFSIAEGPKVMDLQNAKEIFSTAKTLRQRIEANEVKADIAHEGDEADSGDTKAF